jgi:CRISPR/Cas system-associated exonuclease Cas4 (RecB family)
MGKKLTFAQQKALTDGSLTGIDPKNWHLASLKQAVISPSIVLPVIEESLLRRRVDHENARDTQHIHPSEMSKEEWCPRATWYRIQRYPIEREDSFSFHLSNIYEEGHDIHNKYQTWLWDAGVLEGVFQCLVCGVGWYDRSPHVCRECGSNLLRYNEVPLYDEEYRILGHADGVVFINGVRYVIEIKSVGVRTLDFEAPQLSNRIKSGELTLDQAWKDIKQPFLSHRKQGAIYCSILGIHQVVFIYEWKPNQQRREFLVRPSKRMTAELFEQAGTVVHGLRTGFPPRRPEWASVQDVPNCRACPYQETCWKGGTDGATEDQAAATAKPVAVTTTGQRARHIRRGPRVG